jgi:hypothetical protein
VSSVARRFGAALAAVAFGAGVGAAATAPAFAHGGGTPIPDAAFYRTEITQVTSVPGVTAKVDPAGDWLELTNTGAATVIVYGYMGEPYLRVTTGGVDENEVSPSTYLNRSLFADTAAVGGKAADVAPAWTRVAQTGRIRWHDHRIHWMGQTRPPAVDADPTRPHQVGTWVVHASVDGAPFEVRGALRWIGKPGSRWKIASWELIVANSVILLGAFGVFWYVSRRRRRKAAAAARPAPDARDEPDEEPSGRWLVSTDGPR